MVKIMTLGELFDKKSDIIKKSKEKKESLLTIINECVWVWLLMHDREPLLNNQFE